MTLLSALDPMLRVDPVKWQGLPAATAADFDALFGPPEEKTQSTLGWYPATRCLYRSDDGTRGLVLWVRDGAAVMVETLEPPPVSVLNVLPQPSAVLPNEILVPGAYAHEYLYSETGLVLTVAEPLHAGSPDNPTRIVRCRGIKPLSRVEEFGPAYYRAFDDQVQWAGATLGGA